MKSNVSRMSLYCAAWACAVSCTRGEFRQHDLTMQPDRWVKSVVLDSGSKVNYVGKTRDYVVTAVEIIKRVSGVPAISIGDEVGGLRIGAIRCTFYWRDASYGGEQYMWRGRWGCQAGRTKQEVEQAVAANGEKRFEYLHVAPVHENQLGLAE